MTLRLAICALVWLAGSATAGADPQVHEIVVEACLTDSPICLCPAGTAACINRASISAVNLLIKSEVQCQARLGDCRAAVKPQPAQGWKPGVVIGVTIGIVVGAIGLGFGLGAIAGAHW